MNISKGKVVQFNYVLRNSKGEEVDRSEKGEAFEYLHGASQIVAGLERGIEGLTSGDKKMVTVPPAEAYGEVNPQLKAEIDRSAFPKDMPIEPGVQFRADLEGGPMILRIESVNGDKVMVDGNHPLAGETLHFEVEIVSVRDATKEELAHGHVHGPNGHAH